MHDNMNIELTAEQKSALEAQHRDCCDRCVLLSAQGWSTAIIAQSQLIHETTVLRHIANAHKHNFERQQAFCETYDKLKQDASDRGSTLNGTVSHVKAFLSDKSKHYGQ